MRRISTSSRHEWAAYAVAIVGTGLIALVRSALEPIVGQTSPYTLFLIAVMAAAAAGGAWPGLLATVLGAIAGTLLFVWPYGQQIHPDDVARIGIFLSVATCISLLAARMHAHRREAQEQARVRGQTLELLKEDVARRQAAEAALVESQEALRTAFDSAYDGILIHSVDGTILDVNNRCLEMYGVSREQVLHLTIADLSSPASPVGDTPQIWARVMAGQTQLFPWKARRPGDDTEFDVEVFLRRIRVRGQDVILANVRDVTERKRAEEALRRAEQRLRATFDNAGVGIVEVESEEDQVVAVNDRMCEILGYRREQLLAMSVHDLTYSEDRAMSDRLNAELRNGLRPRLDYEKRYLKADGSWIWVHVTVTPIRDAAGNAVRRVGTVEDISARKRAEEDLKAAKAAAERANAAKNHFLAVLSHELRTPLSPVLTMASLLEREAELPRRYREDVEMIRRNVELEARLIDDLLDVTRIERGKVELDKRPLDLCAVIRRAVEVCRADIEARHLDFGVDARGGPYILEADASRLQQVFWNLLKNSIKFTPVGGCVGIRCRRGEGEVTVEINDSGAGIAPEVLPRLFNAFEQGDRGMTRQFGGLGLGLAISRAMVEMHGGRIEAHSEGKNRGATFSVTLPLLSQASLERPGESRAAASVRRNRGFFDAAPALVRARAPMLRILLVEDHGDTARIMRRLLTSEGHQVETAADLATALAKAGEGEFDLLLSDLGLPDGNGLDLIRTLRARGLTLPGIAMSGYGQEQDLEQSREAGFVLHLVKPVNPDRLREAIASVARRAQA